MPLRPLAAPSNSRFNNVPQPEGITPPVKEKPRTVVPEEDTVKPLVSASPPEALIIVAPSTLN